MTAGRPSKYKPEFCEMVIAHMEKGNSFWSFAAEVDVCFDTLSEWCRAHPEFSEAKKRGMAKLLKFDEQLNLMGSSGQLKRVARVETITEDDGNGGMRKREIVHHDSATFAQTYRIFMMKNRYPNFYRDKIEIESSNLDSIKKTAEVIEEVMLDPNLMEAARAIADKLSEE
jgi:transposase